jgi:hypothetical protein
MSILSSFRVCGLVGLVGFLIDRCGDMGLVRGER